MSVFRVPGVLPFSPCNLLQQSGRLGQQLGIDLAIQRDDLIPAPMGGNKWIKLGGILGAGCVGSVYISNGGIHSNHCKTMALWSAYFGHKCHFVLHGNQFDRASRLSIQVLTKLGATYEVVEPERIAERIKSSADHYAQAGLQPVIVPGGGHSANGIMAYSAYAAKAISNFRPDYIVHASGTGGTQAGIIHAAHTLGFFDTQIIGISVARSKDRGTQVISDSLMEIGLPDMVIDFRDEYRGPGYGLPSAESRSAVAFAAKYGLVLDLTYTGKAFAGLLDLIDQGIISEGSRVVFWHTGGTFLGSTIDMLLETDII